MGFPLMFASQNKNYVITKISGNESLTKHLHDLGFVDGAVIQINSIDKGGVTIKIHETKLALDRNICNNIFIDDYENENEQDNLLQ